MYGASACAAQIRRRRGDKFKNIDSLMQPVRLRVVSHPSHNNPWKALREVKLLKKDKKYLPTSNTLPIMGVSLNAIPTKGL
jgi:hypothetical protein